MTEFNTREKTKTISLKTCEVSSQELLAFTLNERVTLCSADIFVCVVCALIICSLYNRANK